MATAIARRPSAPVRRSGPSPKLVKLQERAKSASKRATEVAKEEMEGLAAIGTAIGIGMLQKEKVALPTIMGINPTLLYGAVGYVLTRKARSGAARTFRQVSLTSLAIGAKDSTVKGSIKVGGVEIEGEDDDDL